MVTDRVNENRKDIHDMIYIDFEKHMIRSLWRLSYGFEGEMCVSFICVIKDISDGMYVAQKLMEDRQINFLSPPAYTQ